MCQMIGIRSIVRFGIPTFIASVFSLLLLGCGVLYEHKSDVPDYPDEVKSTLSIGDTSQKVHSVLGEPLIVTPDHRLEVYRKSGSDFAVLWVFVPWVPLPAWGDSVVVVVLILYDDQETVSDIRTGFNAADADGFSFIRTPHKKPATLLGPPISSEELEAFRTDNETCQIIFVMGNCPMEKISLNGHVIADFPYVGMNCGVEHSTYQPTGLRRTLKGNLLWKRIKPGTNQIRIQQRILSGNFDKSFECEPGETVYARLIGKKWHREPWTFHHLEGSIRITKGTPDNLNEFDGARFILWHSGEWFGMPDFAKDQ